MLFKEYMNKSSTTERRIRSTQASFQIFFLYSNKSIIDGEVVGRVGQSRRDKFLKEF